MKCHSDLQISADVGTCKNTCLFTINNFFIYLILLIIQYTRKNPGRRRKENTKHRKKIVLHTVMDTIIWLKVLAKYCC